MIRHIFLTLMAIGVAQAAAADIYKCTDDNGRPSFSQTPCGDTAEVIDVRPVPADTENSAMLQERMQRYRKGNAAAEHRRRDRKIRALEAKKGHLRQQRDQQIAIFENELNRAFGYNRAILRNAILGERQSYDLQAKEIDQQIEKLLQ